MALSVFLVHLIELEIRMIKELGASKAAAVINIEKSEEPGSHQVEADYRNFTPNIDMWPGCVHMKNV